MIDVKRCASCMRMLCVSEFDFQKNNNGRKRRKVTCRSCLGRQKERRDNKPAIDTRDIKLELERAIHEMVRSGRAAQHDDDEVLRA